MVDTTDPAPPAAAETRPLPDFSDTRETFRHLSDGDLRRASFLFGLMGRPWLTNLLSRLGAWAVRWRIPGAAWGVRQTIYRQFVGGTSLENALPKIEKLHERGVTSILDFGIEAKSSEEDFERFRAEIESAIEFSSRAPAAGFAVVKVTGIAPNDVLEGLNETEIDFDAIDDPVFQRVVDRMERLCSLAASNGVELYVDAEESWFQNTIDQIADEMMRRHNRERIVVFNTYQLYRHDRLAFLKASHERAQRLGYRIGGKLVRGAYMVKEGERAEERGLPTPIQPSLEATHRDYDAAVRYCLERSDEIAIVIGTHNEASTAKAASWMDELGIPRDHPHVRFAQLLGMSDNLTFNLASAGFNASKYFVYGPVADVLPYLVRRAQENTSVTGEMGRELRLLREERKRRRRS